MPKSLERALQMLSTALEMEKKGKDFYEKAVTECQNEPGRVMFQMLMKDERIHMDRILQVHESLKKGDPWPEDWKSIKPDHEDLSAFFGKMASAHGTTITATTNDLEALDVGIDFESRAVAFYQDHLEASEDPLERAFIEQMIAEEKGHYAALSDMKLYLSDPSTWFAEQEHSGLDGA